METKKYYALRASMTFERTILVPVDSVEDIDEAIDLIDCSLEIGSIVLLNEEPDCNIEPTEYADVNGMYELSDKDAECYEIIKGDKEK